MNIAYGMVMICTQHCVINIFWFIYTHLWTMVNR